MPINKKEFFACANSGCGFINRFNDIFSPLSHLYIIKGGSGTGKSFFMKKVADKAQSLGYEVKYCLCSSDPTSLDGIIIDNIGLGIIDGTAPHSADTHYPGAYDEIINMGDFWNTDILTENKNSIIDITDRKTKLFCTAYTILNGAYQIEKTQDHYLKGCFNYTKATKTIDRILSSLSIKQRVYNEIYFTEALSMNGRVLLRPHKNAQTIYSVKDEYGMGFIFMDILKKYISDHSISHNTGYNALDPKKINMLYINNNDILFEINSPNENSKNINMSRFLYKEEYRKERPLLRKVKKMRNSAVDQALEIMERIKEKHFSLEEIYKSAMDFEKKEKFEENLITKILGSY